MKRDRWNEMERLFLRALDLPPEEREAFIRAQAGEDDELRREVLRMLAHGAPENFIEPPTPAETQALEVPPLQRLGEFELLEKIGEGGMGIVYRAWQPSLQRTVAVKVAKAMLGLTDRQIEDFEREARSGAKLTHPGIVKIHSVGSEGGVSFFAMEYVEGASLKTEIERLREHRTPPRGSSHLPDSRETTYFRRVAEIIMEAADAIHYAHENGIIHRDVKPGNLLLDTVGRVRLVDFGLARNETEAADSQSGVVRGTVPYLSPEQVRASRSKIDLRTDVYSLGVVLFELLTLRTPFLGDSTVDILRKIEEKDPPVIRRLNTRVPRDLAIICAKAISKEPRHRHQSADELRSQLEKFLNGEAIDDVPPTLAQRASRFGRRNVRLLALTLLVLLSIAATSIWSRRLARADRIWSALEVVRGTLGETPLEALSLEDQLDLRKSLWILEGEDAAGEEREGLAFAFEELREDLWTSGTDLAESVRLSERSPGQKEQLNLESLLRFWKGAVLFPEDERFRRATTGSLLSVSALDPAGLPVAAQVYVREVDPYDSSVGDPDPLGATPLESHPLQRGVYRVIVEFDTGGLLEYPIIAGLEATRIEAVRRPGRQEPPEDWVRFEATSYTFPEDSDIYPGERCYHGRTVVLNAFYASPYEARNSDYHAFLADTGRDRPALWGFIEDDEVFLERYGDLPLVGVSIPDAQAFATWMGARLPTAAEFFRMAAGLEGRPLPYETDSPETDIRGNVIRSERLGKNPLASWELYLRSASPVDSHSDARTPEGLHHMYGNVNELTESLAVIRSAEHENLIPLVHSRFRFGGTWAAHQKNNRMLTPGFVGTGRAYARPYIGLRLVRSQQR